MRGSIAKDQGIQLMDALLAPAMKPSSAVREHQRNEPADVGFEEDLEVALGPPETPPPSEHKTPEEGATRKEADLDQSNTEDQTLDQPQNAQELFISLMPKASPLETRKIAVGDEKAVFHAIRSTKVGTGEGSDPEEVLIEHSESSSAQNLSELEGIEQVLLNQADQVAPEQNPIATSDDIPSFSEMPTRYVYKDLKSEDEETTPEVEAIEVERSSEALPTRSPSEQLQSKPHPLDRPVQALDEIKEVAQRPQADLPVGASRVKVTLNPEEFGNLTVTIKNFGKSLEADVQSQNEPLNNALHTHRADLVQSVESKGLSLSNFNVSQDSGQQTQQGHGQSHSETMRQEFELMNLLSDSAPEAPVRPSVLGSGLINTIA